MFDRNNTIISSRLKTVESIKGAKKGLQVLHPIERRFYIKENTKTLSGNLEEELMKELYDVFTIFDEDDKILAVSTENLLLSFDYFDTKFGWYRNTLEHLDTQQWKYVKFNEKEIDYDAINLFADLAVKYNRAKNIFFVTYDISVFSVINPQKLNMPCIFLKKDGQIEFIEKKITAKQIKNYDTDIQVRDKFKHFHFQERL